MDTLQCLDDDTYGEDKSDSWMLDQIKAGSNVIFNGITPMLTRSLKPARDAPPGWQNDTPEAEEFRRNIADLHRHLEQCVFNGRRGRVSFETVDTGANLKLNDSTIYRGRTITVQRGVPASGNVTCTITASGKNPLVTFTQATHNQRDLENSPEYLSLTQELRSKVLFLHQQVTPRKKESVLFDAASASGKGTLDMGGFHFIDDPAKLFSAVMDIIYSLRNALFHGSITPNDQHNQIYEPAYYIAMRMVQCTI